MRRIVLVRLLVAAFVVCLMPSCFLNPFKTQTVESPVETPTPVPPTLTPTPEAPEIPPFEGPYLLSLNVPERLQVGTVTEASVVLVGTGDISELALEIRLPVLYLYVEDQNPAADGVQVAPGVLPEGAQVLLNDVSADGLLSYKVAHLGASAQVSRTILTLRLAAAAPSGGIVALEFEQAALLGAGGVSLAAVAQPALVEVVLGEVAAPPAAPSLPGAVGAIAPGVYCRLQPGQTLYRLSRTFGSTPEEIARVNGIVDVTAIPVGALLRIPATPPSGQAAYFVAPRETLYSIARAFGVTVEMLAAQNAIAPPYHIKAGQWVILRP